jgi:hypothetical protein
MPSSPNKYLIIPIDQELDKSDDYNLSKALEDVAKTNKYRNGKDYLKKRLGCSGNSVKNMTRKKIYPWTFYWDIDEYETKDAYRYIRKLDKEKYADMINLIVSEYAKIASKDERNTLREYLNKYNISPPSYQTALYYRSIDGLQTVIFDPKTANRVNKIENAKDIAKKIIDTIDEKKVNIQP